MKKSFQNKTTGITGIAKIFTRAKHDDLLYLFMELAAGSALVAMPALAPVAIFVNMLMSKKQKCSEAQLKNSFYHFRKKGWIAVDTTRGQSTLSLTKEGVRHARFYGAGKVLSNNLHDEKIEWDKKWRIVFFDLATHKNKERNAIRFMLRRCGFVFLQKSVWIYPYDCANEIIFLRSFFRLTEEEFRMVISDDIGESKQLRKHFKLPPV